MIKSKHFFHFFFKLYFYFRKMKVLKALILLTSMRFYTFSMKKHTQIVQHLFSVNLYKGIMVQRAKYKKRGIL